MSVNIRELLGKNKNEMKCFQSKSLKLQEQKQLLEQLGRRSVSLRARHVANVANIVQQIQI